MEECEGGEFQIEYSKKYWLAWNVSISEEQGCNAAKCLYEGHAGGLRSGLAVSRRFFGGLLVVVG